MTLKQRRILYSFFISVFLLITPLILLYASGYKLTQGLNFEKTGILIVDSKPEGARVYINGKIQKKFWDRVLGSKNHIATPCKIKNLKPGNYDIELKKEGYLSWSKKLSIKPGESTYIEDVELFQSNMPEMILAGDFSRAAISPGGSYILAGNASTTSLIKLDSGQAQSFSFAFPPESMIAWSPSGRQVIAGKRLIRLKTSETEEYSVLEQARFVFWPEEGRIYLGTGDDIFRLDPGNGRLENISSQKHQSMLADRRIFWTSQDGQTITSYDPADQSRREISSPIKNLELKSFDFGYLNAYNSFYGILYIIDPDSSLKPIRDTVNYINNWQWIAKNRLLYYNDHEIWLLDIRNGSFSSETLLTRIGSRIEDAFWHPSNNYVLYRFDNRINIIELDNRDKYNISELIQLPKIKNAFLNQKGDVLYLNAEIGTQKGIYRLIIQ